MRRHVVSILFALVAAMLFVHIVRFLTVARSFHGELSKAIRQLDSPGWTALWSAPSIRSIHRECLTTCTIFALIVLVSYLTFRCTARIPHEAARWRQTAFYGTSISFIILAVSTASVLFGSAFQAGIQLPFGGMLGVSDSGIYLSSECRTERRAWVEVWDVPGSFEFWAFSFADGPYILRLPIWMLTLAIVAPAAAYYVASRRPLPGHCRCGYNLTGNMSGVCPECGIVCRKKSSTETSESTSAIENLRRTI